MELKCNKGFTLAEVLITLVIIGVIAAITIPVLSATWHEQATVAKVKKIYSTISQAQRRAIADQGSNISSWKYNNTQELMNYFKPYLRIMKECSNNNSSKECSASRYIKYLNGEAYPTDYSKSGYVFILDDGSTLWAHLASSETNDEEHCTGSWHGYGFGGVPIDINGLCASFFYDTNGLKEPNTLGKDIFTFFLLDYSITPHPQDDCRITAGGWGCMNYILKNSNMKYPK